MFPACPPARGSACRARTPPTVYPRYEVKGVAAFFGESGWVCENAIAQVNIVSYGFTRLASCGRLTAGD
jgi:hypothetical protein